MDPSEFERLLDGPSACDRGPRGALVPPPIAADPVFHPQGAPLAAGSGQCGRGRGFGPDAIASKLRL